MNNINKEFNVKIEYILDELWELIPKDFNYRNVDKKTLYNWLHTQLEDLVYNQVIKHYNTKFAKLLKDIVEICYGTEMSKNEYKLIINKINKSEFKDLFD